MTDSLRHVTPGSPVQDETQPHTAAPTTMFAAAARVSGPALQRKIADRRARKRGDATSAQPAPAAQGHPLGKFKITHYTYALEADPKYDGSPLVSAPGLPANRKYKQAFLGSPYGIQMQGTGLAHDGNYIRYVGNGSYAYGVGGAAGAPAAWSTIAVDPRVIPYHSSVNIDIYKSKGPFTANDTGSAIKGKHIDVFAGAIPIAEAYALGTKYSKVELLSGGSHPSHHGHHPAKPHHAPEHHADPPMELHPDAPVA